MKKYLIILTLLFSLLAIFTGCIEAETGKLVGLSHGFVNVQGIDALYTNPAVVGDDNKSFVINLNGMGSFTNNAIGSEYFQDIEDIDELEQTIKNDILTNLDGDPFILSGNGVQGVELQLGNLALFADVREVGAGTLANDIVELILNGSENGTYDFSDSDGDMAFYSDIGISYSLALKSVARGLDIQSFRIGGTAHYLNGAVASFNSEGSILIVDPVVSGDGMIEGKYAEEGTGYSFDLGLSATVNDNFSWGVSVMNIGSIKGTDPRYYKYEYNIIEEDFIKSEDEPLASLTYKLPLEVKVGTRLDLTKMIDVYGDFAYISYDSGKIDKQIAAGTEINILKVLPLRIGARYSSLQDNVVYSGGAGLYLGPFRTSIGISDLGALFDEAKSLSLAVNTSFAF